MLSKESFGHSLTFGISGLTRPFPNAPPPSNRRRVSLARRNIRKANTLQVRQDLHVYSAPGPEGL